MCTARASCAARNGEKGYHSGENETLGQWEHLNAFVTLAFSLIQGERAKKMLKSVLNLACKLE
jgi:hypothetical protein